VIIDCGANIGIASLYFLHQYPDCRILAFEPEPAAYRLLERNLRPYPNVETFEVALGKQESTLEFFEDSINKASHCASGFRDRPANSSSITVDCVRLSRFLPRHVDLLKVDVEGMEWEILDDLESTGSLDKVDRIAIEYHHHLPADQDRLGVFLGRLEVAGFGYELAANHSPGLEPRSQDVMIYAYRKPRNR
jgi:FkbM family methyltransferase